MKFSQRKGHAPVSTVVQVDDMSDALRNSLWNTLDSYMWSQMSPYDSSMQDFSRRLWSEFFKVPVDNRPSEYSRILREIRAFFFDCSWYEVYDFLEWVVSEYHIPSLVKNLNVILERELAGYRIVNDLITDITDTQEISALEQAISDDDFPAVSQHLQTALRHLSNRDAPDYRNSIKESISAVESLAQVISGRSKVTLGEALAELEKNGKIHGALKQGFSSLYGYTSDADGIRHAMLSEPDLGANDAKFFLLSCTSFINYLKTKI